MKKKSVALLLALVLVFGAAIGGTIAYLMDTTAKIDNVFTVGKVDIELAETTKDFKMTPGQEIAKDPKVTVVKGSEECWLFVKIDESENLDKYITYTVSTPWQALDETKYPGVYFIEQAATTDAAATYSVLTNDKVLVNAGITNADMTAAETAKPTLSFTAYAIQKAGFDNAADAWAELNK